MNGKVVYFVIFLLGLIGGFLEIIVFNEEVLLALCFISFVFFARNYLTDTVFAIFNDHAVKIESDILLAFESKHVAISTHAGDLALSKMFLSGLTLLESFIRTYNVFIFNNVQVSYRSSFLTLTVSRLNEIALAERILKNVSQKANIQNGIYPVIFAFIRNRYIFNGDLIDKK